MTHEASPLRQHGIYILHGVEYTAVHLSSEERPWRSTALLHPPGAPVPRRILYLRHGDGAILDAADFRATGGTILDLIDTGRDDAGDTDPDRC